MVSTAAFSNLPTSSTGDTPLAYTVSPALPAGLTLGRVTGAISGTATAESPSIKYTLTVTDANGDTDTLPFALGVTGNRPTVRGVSFLSSPSSMSTYGFHDDILVSVRFWRQGTGAMVVSGSPRLAINVGGVTRQAAYYGVSGDNVRFRYTVQAGDSDTDGVSIGAGALTLNGGYHPRRRLEQRGAQSGPLHRRQPRVAQGGRHNHARAERG